MPLTTVASVSTCEPSTSSISSGRTIALLFRHQAVLGDNRRRASRRCALCLISTHWLVRPMRQNEQKPQRMLLSTATRSPILTCWTCVPTSTTSPQNSWPRTVFGLKWCLPSRIFTSVPQMPTRLTLITTSSGWLTWGTARCSSTSLPTSLNTSAFILSMVSIPVRFQAPWARAQESNVIHHGLGARSPCPIGLPPDPAGSVGANDRPWTIRSSLAHRRTPSASRAASRCSRRLPDDQAPLDNLIG